MGWRAAVVGEEEKESGLPQLQHVCLNNRLGHSTRPLYGARCQSRNAQ